MFRRRLRIPTTKKDPVATKVVRAHIATISDNPELGMLSISTDQGPVRLLIDKDRAYELMDECLKLLGYPPTMD
jgi:hypothetical protein